MLKIYNTLTRQKEEFEPLKGKKVGLYACGPTVYDFAHIGNLRTYIFEDVLKRALKHNGYKVKHVMNVTDVGHLTSDADEGEDKMETAARAKKKGAREIANFYLKIFKSDLKKLNIKSPNIWCRASEYIVEQIEMIKKLEEKGYTYKIEDGIYFDTSKLADYGKLVGLDKSGLKPGARIEIIKGKKNATDFALWKFSPKNKKRLQEWQSPWGKGFPGWHIECSSMSHRFLGKTFDIHCGGVDLAPVHHTNEIAQSEAANGAPPVKYWLHGEFLDMGDAKMSKSKGNFLTLADLIKNKFNPLAFRYLTYTAHYRTKLNFTKDALIAARNSLDKIYSEISTWDRPSKGVLQYEEKFFDAVNDDLNMPKAIAVMHNMINDNIISSAQKKRSILKFDDILALDFSKIRKQKNKALPKSLKKLIAQRETLRHAGQYQESDLVRQKIEKMGYKIEDSASGPRVFKAK